MNTIKRNKQEQQVMKQLNHVEYELQQLKNVYARNRDLYIEGYGDTVKCQK